MFAGDARRADTRARQCRQRAPGTDRAVEDQRFDLFMMKAVIDSQRSGTIDRAKVHLTR